MPPLIEDRKPLNQHSLMALEGWLTSFGAKRSIEDVSLWELSFPQWSAEIQLEQDEIRVIWQKKGRRSECCFSYGLTQKDVEDAIFEGPSN